MVVSTSPIWRIMRSACFGLSSKKFSTIFGSRRYFKRRFLHAKYSLNGLLCDAHELVDLRFCDHKRRREVHGIAGCWMKPARGARARHHTTFHHLGLQARRDLPIAREVSF